MNPVATVVHMTASAGRAMTDPQDELRERNISGERFNRWLRTTTAILIEDLTGEKLDPAKDIIGITVNRWPHGYAPEYNALIDPDEGLPLKAARARFGAITIANSDCGGGAYTDVAIDMAHRAVGDLSA